jgi:hypothetical protein
VARSGTRIAALVFDSFLATGATAGTRSISSGARHLVYAAGPLTIDVRLNDFGSTDIMMAGKVLQAAAENAAARRATVTLMCGDSTFARTSTNEFGEFQFESEGGSDLRILLAEVGGEQPLILTLPDS